ncbi:type IV secretion protein Rhs [Bacteroidia bacterium]|nr:type IV secretion protein Rhs [Bacteroidia bacterium]
MANNPIFNRGSRISSSILVKGKELDYRFKLSKLTVMKEFNKISSAEIVLLDGDVARGDFETSNTDEVLIGNGIEIQTGYDGHNETIFKGIIVKLAIKAEEETSYLVVTAKDEACKMTTNRHNVVYSEASDSDVIEEIIQKYGLKLDIDKTSFKYESLTQYNSNDWDFINMRAEINSMLVYTKDGEVVVKKPDLEKDPKLEIHYGSGVFDFEAEIDGRTNYTEYEAESWNFSNQEPDSVSQKTGIGDTPQGNILSKDLASAMQSDTCKIAVQSTLNDKGVLTDYLNAMIMRDNLSRITGSVRIYGFADIHPGDMIDLQRVGDRFNGKTFVTGIEHQIEEGEWFTTIRFGMDASVYAKKYDDINSLGASGMLPAINGLQTGKVMQLEDDPLGEDRILICLTGFASGEKGIWARIATLDAGNERGSFFRPEVDDEVIVGFINDHPDGAVVLGMMNSSTIPAPQKTDAVNNIKGIYTRSKIKLEFDDEKKSVLMETPGGNKLSISDDAQGISLEDQHGNKVVLDSNGITIESAGALNLKAKKDVALEGLNIDIIAQSAFKAEGGSGAEVSTSGNAVLKGALVQIN